MLKNHSSDFLFVALIKYSLFHLQRSKTSSNKCSMIPGNEFTGRATAIYRKNRTHPSGERALWPYSTTPQQAAKVQKKLSCSRLAPLRVHGGLHPGSSPSGHMGSTGVSNVLVLPGPDFTRCSVTSISQDLAAPLHSCTQAYTNI